MAVNDPDRVLVDHSTWFSDRRRRKNTAPTAGSDTPRYLPAVALREPSSPCPPTSGSRHSMPSDLGERNYEHRSRWRDLRRRPGTEDKVVLPISHPFFERSNGVLQHVLNNHGDSGVLTKLEEPTPCDNHSLPSSSISTEVQSFLKEVRFRDLIACARFINSHPAILSDAAGMIEELLSVAGNSLQANDLEQAKSCVEKALILRTCRGMSAAETTAFFRDLHVQDAKTTLEFEQNSSVIMTELLQSIRDRSITVDGDQNAYACKAGTSDSETVAPLEHVQVPNRVTSESEGDVVERTRKRRAQDAADLPILRAMPATSIFGRSILDPRYSVRDSSFFQEGRVFAVAWPEQIPEKRKASTSSYTSDPPIYHSTRTRMAVIRQRDGYCVCIRINSYVNRGLDSFQKPRDVNAHAIVYMSGTQPQERENGPHLTKKPIRVIPSPGAADELEPTSRIHFGKVHTVEHNVKVKDVGRISKDSMPYFDSYWKRELIQ